MRIVTVVGARPQFVKASVISRLLRARPGVREVLIHTGQHYDSNMSEVFFRELAIPKPDYHLGVGSLSHGKQTGAMLGALEDLLLNEVPDWVIVLGDTNSTLAGALAASKLHIPVAHVEAGLRSFNMRMPEEINRVLTDHVSSLLFAPTEQAARNLAAEGISGLSVKRTGDIMLDVSLHYAAVAEAQSTILRRLELQPASYVLATVHRQENTDDPVRLATICQGLMEVCKRHPVVLPLHPRTKKCVAALGLKLDGPDLHLVDPVSYLDMIALERSALVVATDSGGVQKEAYFFRVPCVTLREETEWVELVSTGWNRLASLRSSETVAEAILSAVGTQGASESLYGDGKTAETIVAELMSR